MNDTTVAQETRDVMDELAGLAPDSPIAALRRQRADVVRHTQGSDEALFNPQNDGGLTRAERAAAALRIAVLLRDPVLQAHYRGRLAPLDLHGSLAHAAETGAMADARLATILGHVDTLTNEPNSATRSHLDALAQAGLTPRAILALSQLIAYVNFQARVAAGLRMLRDAS
jgi:CMD domain protein